MRTAFELGARCGFRVFSADGNVRIHIARITAALCDTLMSVFYTHTTIQTKLSLYGKIRIKLMFYGGIYSKKSRFKKK